MTLGEEVSAAGSGWEEEGLEGGPTGRAHAVLLAKYDAF